MPACDANVLMHNTVPGNKCAIRPETWPPANLHSPESHGRPGGNVGHMTIRHQEGVRTNDGVPASLLERFTVACSRKTLCSADAHSGWFIFVLQILPAHRNNAPGVNSLYRSHDHHAGQILHAVQPGNAGRPPRVHQSPHKPPRSPCHRFSPSDE